MAVAGCVALALGLAACTQQPSGTAKLPATTVSASRPPPAKAVTAKPIAPHRTAAASVQPPQWVASPAQSAAENQVPPIAATGIPGCDRVASAARQCLNERVRGLPRPGLVRQLETNVKRWHADLASGTATTADVAAQCAKYRARIAARLHRVGCKGF